MQTPFTENQGSFFYHILKNKYLISLIVGLSMSVVGYAYDYLSDTLLHNLGITLYDPLKFTYFISYLLSAPTAVVLNRYLGLLEVLLFNPVSKIGIITNIGYMLPLIFAIAFQPGSEELGIGPIAAMIGFGIVICCVIAVLQAVFIEKFFNRA